MARVVRVGGVVGIQTYASLDDQPVYGIATEVKSTPLVDRLTDAQLEQIPEDMEDLLTRHQAPDGSVRLPIRSHLITGRRTA